MTRALLLACVLAASPLGGCRLPFGAGGEDQSWSLAPRDRVAIEPGLEVTLLSPDTAAAASPR